MKKLLIFIGVILILVSLHVFTYKTIANNELTKVVIQNIQADDSLKPDTILYNCIISTCGNNSIEFKYYDLHLYMKENIQLMQDKLRKFKVLLDDGTHREHISNIAQSKLKTMSHSDWNKLMKELSASVIYLHIVAEEKPYYTVNVSTKWRQGDFNLYQDDKYLWVLFAWIKKI